MDAMPPAPAHAAPSWREERRQDRLAAAQAAVSKDEARARLHRETQQARAADKRAARKQRAARRDARAAWARAHVVDLLFVPVITVPGALAWTAMAAYGSQVFGPAGHSLPAFSEGAMWAFAGATTITRRRHPERPVWHLQLGTVVFAAFGAALNFAHGLATGSTVTGTVMALVSVAGVVAHQLITAGPRRSRADRAAARTQRAVVRRERAVSQVALKRATAVLDPAGNARLVLVPGAVVLSRRWGRARLERMPSSRVWLPWPMVLPGSAGPAVRMLLDAQAADAVTAYRGWHSAFMAMPAGGAMEPAATVRPTLPAEPRRPALPAMGSATRDAAPEPPRRAIPSAAKEPAGSATGEPPPRPSAEPSEPSSPAKTAKVAHVDKSHEAERARAAYRKSVRQGKPLTDRALGELFGKSRTWGASRIKEAEAGPHLATRTG